MLEFVIALMLAVGTFLQMKTSLKDFGDSRREAMDWWMTEDALVDGESKWRLVKRRRARRDVQEMRTPEIAAHIAHARTVLQSWILLFTASTLAAIAAFTSLF